MVGEQPHGEILRYDTKLRQYIPYMIGLSAEHLRFSPDGQWVAYTVRTKILKDELRADRKTEDYEITI